MDILPTVAVVLAMATKEPKKKPPCERSLVRNIHKHTKEQTCFQLDPKNPPIYIRDKPRKVHKDEI